VNARIIKKKDATVEQFDTGLPVQANAVPLEPNASSKVSIGEFLKIVNGTARSILSRDVLK